MKQFQFIRASLFVVALVLMFTSALGQVVTIRVIDRLTKKPVNAASIAVRDSVTTTNFSGYAQFDASLGDTVFVHCIDYDKSFAIVPNASKFQMALDKNEFKLDFTDGIQNFYRQLQSRMNYPAKARSAKVQGDLCVEFTVDEDGQSSLVKIHNVNNKLFEEEIKRVFKTIVGTWSADYTNRTFLLPVRYRLSSEKPPVAESFDSLVGDRKLSDLIITARIATDN